MKNEGPAPTMGGPFLRTQKTRAKLMLEPKHPNKRSSHTGYH